MFPSIVAIDFETTGLAKNSQNLPWQIGLVRLNGETLAIEAQYSAYLHVPADFVFNPYTPGRWAELREQLAAAPTMQCAWSNLEPWLTNVCLLAHHASTERGILRVQYPLHTFGPWIDTLELYRRAYPSLQGYTLSELLNTFRLFQETEKRCPGLAPHDALFDAMGCALLLQHLLAQPGWDAVHLDSLVG